MQPAMKRNYCVCFLTCVGKRWPSYGRFLDGFHVYFQNGGGPKKSMKGKISKLAFGFEPNPRQITSPSRLS